MKYLLALASLALLSACASHEPPQASGQWKVLNVGQWDFNPSLVTVPDLPKITTKEENS